MLESLKKTINDLVEEEINKRRKELVKEAANIVCDHSSINLLDIKLLKGTKSSFIDGDHVSMNTVKALFPEPHFKYVSYDPYDYVGDEDDYEPPKYFCWLAKDLKSGIIAGEEDEDDFELGVFKVHKVGKHGRDVKSDGPYLGDKDKFFEAYDNFVADLVLLGLDEQSTDTKE